MALAGEIARLNREFRPDAIFIDGGGVGGGVVDRCVQLRIKVWDIQFGGKADATDPTEAVKYKNKRSEMWGAMREWLKVGSIPKDNDLINELVAPQYGFSANDEIQLERKSDMKRRGVGSPDTADALALTFAYPVMANAFAGRVGAGKTDEVEHEYDPFQMENA